MSVRLLTACLLASTLLAGAGSSFAKPPDLPSRTKVTCTPPMNETAPPAPQTQTTPAGPCNSAGATLADVLRKAAGALPGLVPSVECDVDLPKPSSGTFVIEVSPDADREYRDILITVQESTTGSFLFGVQAEEPTPERVHTGIGKDYETSASALENLEKLKRAHESYERGEFYRRTGHLGAAAFCYESVKRRCPGSPIAARAEVQLKAMLAAAGKDGAEEAERVEPQTCPYLNEKAACEKAKAEAKTETPGDPLSNLDKLEQAEELYRKAMFYQKAGRSKSAVACYEEVRRLCPGSRYSDMASAELKQIASAGAPAAAEAAEEQEKSRLLDHEIEERLRKRVSVHYQSAPLNVVLDDLRACMGMPIVVDQRNLDAEGYHLGAPITLKMEQVQAKSALNMVLRQANLAYVIKDEAVFVTTKSGAEGKPITRTYFIAEFLTPTRRGGNESAAIVKLLTSTVAPQSWAECGGRGSIEYYPLGKSIVVSQTPDVHERIDGMLTALRAFRAAASAGEGEEQESRKPSKPKRKPAPVGKKVSHLLEQCHEAMRDGRTADATRLARRAQALDADAVAADPFVYKMGLLDQVRQEVVSGKPFIEPPLPRFDSGVLVALQRLLIEMKEPQTPSAEEEAELRECRPEAKLLIDEPGCLVLKREDADAVRFAEAIDALRSALLDRLTTAVCAEVDHTRGPTRGRVNVQIGGLNVRAAWDGEGHGSMTVSVPAGSFLEWLASMGER